MRQRQQRVEQVEPGRTRCCDQRFNCCAGLRTASSSFVSTSLPAARRCATSDHGRPASSRISLRVPAIRRPRRRSCRGSGNASLIGVGCSPSPGFTTSDCTTGVSADIHLGDQSATTKSFLTSGPGVTLTVRANGQLLGCTNSGTCSGGAIPVNSAGATPVTITWDWELRTAATWRGLTCTSTGSNPCKASGSFPAVLEAYRSGANSGPIGDIVLRSTSGATIDASQAGALITGSYVTAQLGSSLGDPNQVVTIRLDDPQNNQSLDCDPDNPGGQEIDEISQGCPVVANRASPNAVHYTINSLTDPNWYCADQNSSHVWVWLSGQPRTPPWQCVREGSGFTGNKIADGMAIRTKNPSSGTCTNADNWSHYGDGTPLDPTINKVDPRIIRIFVLPYGSLGNSGTGGNNTSAVLDFAQFYITDWGGQGSNYDDPCPPSAAEAAAGPRPPFGSIAGHFMRFDSSPDSGDIPSDEICDLSPGAVRPCQAVLVE